MSLPRAELLRQQLCMGRRGLVECSRDWRGFKVSLPRAGEGAGAWRGVLDAAAAAAEKSLSRLYDALRLMLQLLGDLVKAGVRDAVQGDCSSAAGAASLVHAARTVRSVMHSLREDAEVYALAARRLGEDGFVNALLDYVEAMHMLGCCLIDKYERLQRSATTSARECLGGVAAATLYVVETVLEEIRRLYILGRG